MISWGPIIETCHIGGSRVISVHAVAISRTRTLSAHGIQVKHAGGLCVCSDGIRTLLRVIDALN